jgi:N-acyl homoserine lactone hydrolase
MRIHALPVGHVVLKQSFLHSRLGVRRRLDLFLPGPWSEPMPIRAWLIEHDEERILIDMGETAEVKDAPFGATPSRPRTSCRSPCAPSAWRARTSPPPS